MYSKLKSPNLVIEPSAAETNKQEIEENKHEQQRLQQKQKHKHKHTTALLIYK